ncbi:MAG TPA: hypothetical protein VK502_02205 [Candidatus Saccharimonadales bacterium]|nr:hypothetical protein [Candidatus Saccharimonadales bacterium]
MSERKTHFFKKQDQDPDDRERISRKRKAAITALAVLAVSACGDKNDMGSPTPSAPEKSLEIIDTPQTPMETLTQYASTFSEDILNQLSQESIKHTGADGENIYEVSNTSAEKAKTPLSAGERRSSLTATLDLDQKTLKVKGLVATKNDPTENILAAAFRLDPKNPVFQENPDAPVTTKSFANALSDPATFDLTDYFLSDTPSDVLTTLKVDGSDIIALDDETSDELLPEAGKANIDEAINKDNFNRAHEAVLGK